MKEVRDRRRETTTTKKGKKVKSLTSVIARLVCGLVGEEQGEGGSNCKLNLHFNIYLSCSRRQAGEEGESEEENG